MNEISRQIAAGQIPSGYVQTEAGILPADWGISKLSEIAEELTEQAGKGKYETLSISAGVGFVNQAQKFGKELSGKQYEKYIVLHKGDFSYNKGNSKTAPQGCIYRLKDRDEAAVPNVFESFRIHSGNPDYYEQLFLHGFLNKQLYRKINHGVRDDGLLNLTGKDFYSCVLPVPPYQEQEKIAEILGQFDTLIELKKQRIAELQRLKQACLKKMFPCEDALYPEIRFPGFTDPWEQHKCGEVAELITGYPFESEKFSVVGVPLIRGMNVKRGYLDTSPGTLMRWPSIEGIEQYLLKEKDIVIQMDGAQIGNSFAMVHAKDTPALLVQRVTRVRCKKTDPYFIYQYIQKNLLYTIRKTKTETAVPHLSLNDIRNIEMYIPGVEEQQRIGAVFANLDNLITLHQRELNIFQKKANTVALLLLMGMVRVK